MMSRPGDPASSRREPGLREPRYVQSRAGQPCDACRTAAICCRVVRLSGESVDTELGDLATLARIAGRTAGIPGAMGPRTGGAHLLVRAHPCSRTRPHTVRQRALTSATRARRRMSVAGIAPMSSCRPSFCRSFR